MQSNTINELAKPNTVDNHIPWAKPYFGEDEEEFVIKALKSTWISGGSYVDQLEKKIKDEFRSPYALTTSNGTTALHMAYLGLGIQPGDEIILPGYAFMAGANVAIHMGARPVFAEVDPNTWCVTAASIEKCITKKTRLIVVVHSYGNVCQMDDIIYLGEKYNIPILEDAAESFYSKYKDKYSGTLGTLGTYSFHATKTITTGEGGMVVTPDEDLYEKMWLYRNHGMKKTRYWHELAGLNFRLTNLQAALGCAQFNNIADIINKRKCIHHLYNEKVGNIDGVQRQLFLPDVDPVLWVFAVKLDPEAFPQGRDTVISQFNENDIETRPGFYSASYFDLYGYPYLPVCEDVSSQVICLPTFPELTEEHIDRVISTLNMIKR